MRPEPPCETKKRFVLNTFGSLGDLHPYIALALELRKRGHAPVIAANAAHRGPVEAEDIPFRPVRPDVGDFGDESALMRKVMDLKTGPEFVIRELLMPKLRESYADLAVACEDADVLVSHPMTMSAPLVAEKMRPEGLGWASIGIAPSVFLSAYDPPVFAPAPWLRSLRVLGPGFYGVLLNLIKKSTRSWVAPWHQFRAELGLPPTALNPMFEGQFSSELVLALFSSLIAAPQPDWPPQTVVTGFPFYDRNRNAAGMYATVDEFLNAGEPPIVFTLGSAAVMDAGEFYTQSAEAARKLQKRALLIVGRDPRNRPSILSTEIIAVEYAPFSQIFPRAAVVVHQGGIGTTAQALRAGKPMLLVPFGFDQPDNSARSVRLGLARSIPRKSYSAEIATRELRRLLADECYLAKATEASRQITSENGVGRACDELESLARSLNRRTDHPS
jgi:UDP:flavonoid glycosyltransferase YjiC (YdhE family)